MQLLVGTNAVAVPSKGRGRPVIQNLGPGNVYFDSDPGVTTTTGLKIAPEAAYEFSSASALEKGISLIADAANTDVRVVWMEV